MKNRPIIVAALGSSMASDDAIGLHLLEKLTDLPETIERRFWEDTDSLTLAQGLLDANRPIFLIDCADMGLTAGSWRTFSPESLKIRKSTVSSHGFGMAEALELAASLGFQQDMKIFGVQPFDCSPSLEMTPEMSERFPEILLECQRAIEEFSMEK